MSEDGKTPAGHPCVMFANAISTRAGEKRCYPDQATAALGAATYRPYNNTRTVHGTCQRGGCDMQPAVPAAEAAAGLLDAARIPAPAACYAEGPYLAVRWPDGAISAGAYALAVQVLRGAGYEVTWYPGDAGTLLAYPPRQL
jgi:hypothetical protein